MKHKFPKADREWQRKMGDWEGIEMQQMERWLRRILTYPKIPPSFNE